MNVQERSVAEAEKLRQQGEKEEIVQEVLQSQGMLTAGEAGGFPCDGLAALAEVALSQARRPTNNVIATASSISSISQAAFGAKSADIANATPSSAINSPPSESALSEPAVATEQPATFYKTKSSNSNLSVASSLSQTAALQVKTSLETN